MTPPAATAAARARVAPRSRPRPAAKPKYAPIGTRRVSGPTGGMPAARPAFAGAGASTAAPALTQPFGARLARRARAVPDARLLDRLIRGRAWIMIVAAMLIGLVFVQVSLLKLNSGIGRDVAAAQALQMKNSELRSDISRIDSGQRIVDSASGLGMVMPGPADVTYLTAVHRGR